MDMWDAYGLSGAAAVSSGYAVASSSPNAEAVTGTAGSFLATAGAGLLVLFLAVLWLGSRK